MKKDPRLVPLTPKQKAALKEIQSDHDTETKRADSLYRDKMTAFNAELEAMQNRDALALWQAKRRQERE